MFIGKNFAKKTLKYYTDNVALRQRRISLAQLNIALALPNFALTLQNFGSTLAYFALTFATCMTKLKFDMTKRSVYIAKSYRFKQYKNIIKYKIRRAARSFEKSSKMKDNGHHKAVWKNKFCES